MGLDALNIPDATTPPPDAARSSVRKAIKRARFSRRSVLRTALGAGTVVGVAALNLLPMGKTAYAVPPTWQSCRGYTDMPDSWKRRCNASGDGQNVSPTYCGGGGYHRRDSDGGGCLHRDYTRARRCKTKNAWVWRKSDEPPFDSGPANKRCSDGWTFQINTCSGEPGQRWKSTCIHFL